MGRLSLLHEKWKDLSKTKKFQVKNIIRKFCVRPSSCPHFVIWTDPISLSQNCHLTLLPFVEGQRELCEGITLHWEMQFNQFFS